MTSSEINFVNTCGVCEEIIEESNVSNHICLDGFEKVYVDDNRYFYPVCSNGKIIRRSLINNEERIVLGETVNKEAEMHNNICDSIDVEELLIEEVSKREVLYNYSLPIQERSRNIINEMWAEVSKALNGRLDAKQAAKKWKMLRDSYSRELAKEKLPSGSGQPTSKRKWKHFNRMDFIRDTICTKKTSDNLIDDAENIPPKKKRSLTTICNSLDDTTAPTSALDKIADAIATISTVPEPVQLPMLSLPDKQDEIDGLMLIISNQLRKLPERERRVLLFQILSFINEKLDALSYLM